MAKTSVLEAASVTGGIYLCMMEMKVENGNEGDAAIKLNEAMPGTD